MSVTPRGMSVQEAYREYRAGNLRVNRRYQRKLVWTLEEKRALIDSILRGYPIPLILLAFRTNEDGKKSFEILDGMQRLNAVFTYIENEFDVNDKYYNVDQMARAKQLSEEGEFERVSDPEKLLSAEQCADIADYTFAVSEFPGINENAVHDVFGRINSYGKQLSPQERRQAGVVSSFADMIRELAAEIRGDVSKEILDLSEMPEISVDVAGEAATYRIKASETFWCKQGILRKAQLRDSEDEQMLADLAISVLLREPFGFSGKALDSYYEPDSTESNSVAVQLATYGASRLKTELLGTLSILRETIEEYDSTAGALRRTVTPGAGNPIKTAFYAIFIAMFELCVNDKKSPDDSEAIMSSLHGLQSKLNVAAGQIRSSSRKQNIQMTKALIGEHFVDSEPPAIVHSQGSAIPFENALRRSRIETAAYECKQGLHQLGGDRQRQVGLMDRIVQTLCGIANISPTTEGALFVGVADTDADRMRIQQLDGISAAHVANRFVVGVDREARIAGSTLEDYYNGVVGHISNSGLSEPLKAAVLARCDCITYRSHSVICLWVPAQRTYSTVSDSVYIREGSATIEATGAAAIGAVFERFASGS